MPVLVDFSQIAISSMFALGDGRDVDESMLRHVILNSLRSIRNKTRHYGEFILAIDSANSWRKEVFPYYKANRKKGREDSGLDWKTIYGYINNVKNEIRDNFKYKVIEVPRAEADDVIAALVMANSSILSNSDDKDNILIVSEDKDFIQLQRFGNVKQYAPIREKWLEGNGEDYLFEHILKGDPGDGIPNFLSADSCLVEKVRQKPVMSKKMEEWKKLDQEGFYKVLAKLSDELKIDVTRQYNRNKTVIDLAEIPSGLNQKILEEYENYKLPMKADLFGYFQKNQLRNLIEHINDF